MPKALTEAEKDILLFLRVKLGQSWSRIAAYFGRDQLTIRQAFTRIQRRAAAGDFASLLDAVSTPKRTGRPRKVGDQSPLC
jgi:hypothetical protein